MFLEQQISMISEGSCDTEDCSNDPENFAITRINYIFKYIKIESSYFNLYNILQYCFSCIFDQIIAAVVSI